MYETAKKNIIPDTRPPIAAGNDRWQKLINDKDDKSLWQAINWKGELKDYDTEKPSDEEFQKHLETVLNPHDATPIIEADYHSNVYVPVLDNPTEPQEVDFVIKKINL